MLKKTLKALAIGWTAVIAVLCLVKFGKLPTIPLSGADKYVHFTFHFIFTLLWGHVLWLGQNSRSLKIIAKVVAVSLVYGILIEFLQETCTLTRHADILDVLANLSGAVMAFLVFVFLKKYKD
ncbi:VanZ family protein [Flavobacterium sp. XGLA_31]|uniref:VanZ family protein n=1 Tax=Flavobacterium sp. XGLA_31 TaxID=3447666 RepID=UPI003F3E0125